MGQMTNYAALVAGADGGAGAVFLRTGATSAVVTVRLSIFNRF